ncbi:MAG TPA: hypothetical protein VLY63_05650 [Anaerolineae bacterium]|nr:hypothetical protein [Anaerolineae bacterium]
MPMFPTVEVRWFHRGETPSDVTEWFLRDEPSPDQQPRRIDHYLRLGQRDSIGIKLREGRIEVKRRQHRHGVVRFHDQIAGVVESWRKWSLPFAALGGDLANAAMPAASWIAVQKARLLRKYQIVGEGQLVSVPAEVFPVQGCSVELTGVHTQGEAWWTLAFEAFGKASTRYDYLVLAAETVLAREGGPFLFDPRDSYGYPRWLALLQEMETLR